MATTILDDKKKNSAVDTNKPKGASDSAWEGTKEAFATSNNVNTAKSNMDSASNKFADHTNTDMISKSTQKAMNQSFKVPSAVTEADAWLSSQLEKIQSGKTSYSNQVRDMMDKIMNREKFSYDVDTDPLFQQALASAMNSGKIAMQDTIGQASALTGGYGSTYATSAGNQAYNAVIEDAYDNLPQYYQMAMEAYQMEGDEMYRQYGMLSTEDDKEYNRNIAAYDATYQHRNQLYNESYARFRDDKSDAFATANLEMQQYAQTSNDLYNLYSIASNTYESMYEKGYQSWADRINNAWKTVEAETTDWWNQTNFDESVRQYEKSLAEQQRQHNDQMAYNWASLNSKKSGLLKSEVTEGIPASIEKEAKNAKNDEARTNYVANMVDNGYITREQGAYLLDNYNQGALENRVWTVKSKGGLNWGGGVDKNAKVIDQYDNEYKMDDLLDELSKTMGEDEAEDWIIKLQKDLGISQRD